MLYVLQNRYQWKWKGKMNDVIIGIGSNVKAEIHIPQMLEILKEQVEIVKISKFEITRPVGMENQPYFTNGAVRIRTLAGISEFNSFLKSIEDQLGRDRSAPKFGPRSIDLDIVVWNGKIVDDDYYGRDFLKKSVDELMDQNFSL